MSVVHGIFKLKRSASEKTDPKPLGATRYEVLDDDYVAGVTPGEDGSVTVIIRRGSLGLPAPQKPSMSLVQPEDAPLT